MKAKVPPEFIDQLATHVVERFDSKSWKVVCRHRITSEQAAMQAAGVLATIDPAAGWRIRTLETFSTILYTFDPQCGWVKP